MKKTFATGVRLTPTQAEKLSSLAENLGVSKNRVLGLLIEEAEDKATISLFKKNSRSASAYQGKSATAIGV